MSFLKKMLKKKVFEMYKRGVILKISLKIIVITIALSFGQYGCSSLLAKQTYDKVFDKNVTTSVDQRLENKINIEDNTEDKKNIRTSVSELTLPDFKKMEKSKELPPPKPPMDLNKVIKVQTPVMINAEAMPLSDFIIYALGEVLKITFFIDEPVKNMKTPVTLRMNQEMSPEQVLDIVVGFLEKYDLIIEEKAGALYIVKTKHYKPVDIRLGRDVPESPADIVQIVFFKHVKAQEIEGLIREMLKGGISVRVYFRENALMLTGSASSIKEVVNLINLFDVPYMNQRKLIMLSFTYWQVDDFVRQLTAILQGLGFHITSLPKDAGIYFIPIKALSSLLIIAPDEETVKYILEWHKRLDTPEAAGTDEKAFIYTPKYSKASDLVDSLKRLYISSDITKSSPTPSMTPVGVPQVSQPSPPPVSSPQGKTTASFSVTGLKIAADDKRNIILISASPTQYKTILNFLQSLDAPPRQVLLEATIAELTLKDDLKYGLEWYIKSRMDVGKYKGDYVVSTLGKLGVGTGTGLVYQFVSDMRNIQAVINAFAQDNRINILSSPRLLVLDNQEASIQIGTDVPIITGETKTTPAETGNTIVTQSVQYRSTGLILKIKPNINTEGMLSLDISMESSEAQQNNISDVNSPIILTRNIKTNVVAESQQTIILGGIMSENLSDTQTKVPLVGDIPIIGNLFKNTSTSKTKTELIIMITPIILTTTDEAARITDDIKKSFKWFIKN